MASTSQTPVVTSTVATSQPLDTEIPNTTGRKRPNPETYVKSDADVPLINNTNKTRKRKITKTRVEINVKTEVIPGIEQTKSRNSKGVNASTGNVSLVKPDETKKDNSDTNKIELVLKKVKIEKVNGSATGTPN